MQKVQLKIWVERPGGSNAAYTVSPAGHDLLALLRNMFKFRLLAYRMANVIRSAETRGQDDIGAWSDIIQVISGFAVICNVGLAVFFRKSH